MDEQDFSELLQNIVDEVSHDDEIQDSLNAEEINNASTLSFSAGMVLTDNAGFTITLDDGSEFQVIVVRSK